MLMLSVVLDLMGPILNDDLIYFVILTSTWNALYWDFIKYSWDFIYMKNEILLFVLECPVCLFLLILSLCVQTSKWCLLLRVASQNLFLIPIRIQSAIYIYVIKILVQGIYLVSCWISWLLPWQKKEEAELYIGGNAFNALKIFLFRTFSNWMCLS